MKLPFLILASLTSCVAMALNKPNIILIMADDLGYECIGANGGEDYKTPRIDNMAKTGMRFTNAYANPICTPSRVKIMTGMYNIRNYTRFGILDRNQKTFAHYLKEAGYHTCIAGKWQLGKQKDSAQHFGFDESLLWQHTRAARRVGTKIDSRHVNPRLEKNGLPMDFDQGEFSSDLCVDFIDQFMTKHRKGPMFIYYPMILPHCPFVPTPSSPDFDPKSKGSPTYKGNSKYFKNMVEYIDLLVGRIEDRTEQLGIAENTIIIFTGDNGTDRPVTTRWNGIDVPFGKGKMTDNGFRVPFLIKFPQLIKQGGISKQPMDFADILPTFCELANVPVGENIDGQSLLPVLRGEKRKKDYAYIFFEPKSGNKENARVMARTETHQLQRKGSSGPYILSDCRSSYATKPIPDQTSQLDRIAFEKLKNIIETNDALYQSGLKN